MILPPLARRINYRRLNDFKTIVLPFIGVHVLPFRSSYFPPEFGLLLLLFDDDIRRTTIISLTTKGNKNVSRNRSRLPMGATHHLDVENSLSFPGLRDTWSRRFYYPCRKRGIDLVHLFIASLLSRVVNVWKEDFSL